MKKIKEEAVFRRRKVAIICIVILVIGLGTTAWLFWDFFQTERESEAKMEALRLQSKHMILSESEKDNTGAVAGGEAEEEPQEAAGKELPPNPYESVFAQNKDMTAWLKVDGTKMDYPVMWTPEDENYYLNRDFYGKNDKAGCLLLDGDSSVYEPETTNLIIHGHNMKAGTMFGELDLYRDESYYQEHKEMKLYTMDDERTYEVISAFYSQVYYPTDVVFKYYKFFRADTEEQFAYFYDNIKEMSIYDTGVTAEFGDKFLTLSTCAYQVEDGRFVVVAVERERICMKPII